MCHHPMESESPVGTLCALLQVLLVSPTPTGHTLQAERRDGRGAGGSAHVQAGGQETFKGRESVTVMAVGTRPGWARQLRVQAGGRQL